MHDPNRPLQIHLVKTHPTVRTHFGIVPLRIIQSWAQGSEQYGWHEGDVAVHFAGCWVKGHCKQDWDKFWAMKKIAPPPKKKGWAVWMG